MFFPACCFSLSSYVCRKNVACNGKNTMQLHVLLRLGEATTLSASFDL
jgi:hypothetical protein